MKFLKKNAEISNLFFQAVNKGEVSKNGVIINIAALAIILIVAGFTPSTTSALLVVSAFLLNLKLTMYMEKTTGLKHDLIAHVLTMLFFLAMGICAYFGYYAEYWGVLLIASLGFHIALHFYTRKAIKVYRSIIGENKNA